MKSIFKSVSIVCLIVYGTGIFVSCLDIDWSKMWEHPNIPFPSLTTNKATNITASTATLNGTVMANNTTQTVAFIYYIGDYTGLEVPIRADPWQVSGTTVTKASANITGLLSGTTYNFRLVCDGPSGRIVSNLMSFATL